MCLWGDANHMIFVTSWQLLVKSMATDDVSTVCTKVHNHRAHNITLLRRTCRENRYSIYLIILIGGACFRLFLGGSSTVEDNR